MTANAPMSASRNRVCDIAFETYDASVDSSAIGTSGSMAAASARMRAIRLAGSAAVRTT